jgi:hypothetical protein
MGQTGTEEKGFTNGKKGLFSLKGRVNDVSKC